MNLTEAFKALNALNEDTFDVSMDGIQKLADFQAADDDMDELSVYDIDAEEEEDLLDDYTGKVILDCCVCHSKLYKDKSEVIVDNESQMANLDEECPFCYSVDGFKVIGEVAPYSEGVEEETTEDATDNSDTDETKVDDDEIVAVQESHKVNRGKHITEDVKIISDLSSYKPWSGAVDTWDMIERRGKVDELDSYLEEMYPEGLTETELNDILWFEADTVYEWLGISDEDEDEDDFDESLQTNRSAKKIKEDLEEVTVTADDTKIEVEPNEDGGVTIKTEPCDECDEEPKDEEEVIVPVSDETQAEIESNDGDEETDEYSDIELDDFDEESFDELGESYLKQVYENVKSYKTTKVSNKRNHLFVEGVITFKSGLQKRTNFVFESKDCNKKNKYRLLGENKQITKGSKAFVLTGTVKGKSFVCESLNYKYNAKDEIGRTKRLQGIAKRG